MNITVYSTGCPQCKILKKKLEDSGLEYKLIEDKDVTVKTGQELGVKSAPFMVVDGAIYTFADAVKFVRDNKVK